MELGYLKTLVVVAEMESFSRAAAILCVTQSAVSRRIQFLEEHYAKQLLDRTGAALKPTAAGALLIEKAKKVLEIEKEIHAGLQELDNNQSISLCCTHPFGIAYLPGVLKEYFLRHADTNGIKCVFEMPDRALAGLRGKNYDLAILEHCPDLDLSPFTAYPLPHDEMVFVTPPALGINSSTVDIDLLLMERLYCKMDCSCAKRFLDNNMLAIGRDSGEFRNTVFFDDIPFIIREVLAGNGISFISRSIVAPHLENGTLRAHHVKGFNHVRPRSLILTGRNKLCPALRDLIKRIYHVFELHPPDFLSTTT